MSPTPAMFGTQNRAPFHYPFPFPLPPSIILPTPQDGAHPSMPTIRINQYQFQVPTVYHAGQTMSQAEAQALTSLRAENIRNNFRQTVLKAQGACLPGELIPAPVLAEIQSRLEAYDQNYQFATKHVPALQTSQLVLEAEMIARNELEIQARARGEDLEPGPSTDRAVQVLAQSVEIQTMVRERLRIRQELARQSLEDLV